MSVLGYCQMPVYNVSPAPQKKKLDWRNLEYLLQLSVVGLT